MRHRLTHRMCEACWFHENGLVMPRFKAAMPELMTCCFCGDPTVAGVVVKVEMGRTTKQFCIRNKEILMV